MLSQRSLVISFYVLSRRYLSLESVVKHQLPDTGRVVVTFGNRKSVWGE